jgi:hypothetical protein
MEFGKNKTASLRKEEIVRKLREAIEPEDASGALAFFHKLESMSEDDVREMLTEVNFLELIRKSNKPT